MQERPSKGKELTAFSDDTTNSHRVHPLFPTYQEIQDHPELLYSDHLPVLFHIPVTDSSDMRIISWNVLGFNAPSGFHKRMRGWETKEVALARYERITDALQQFVEKQDPDVIVLQEAEPTLIFELLQKKLSGWVINDTGNGPAFHV